MHGDDARATLLSKRVRAREIGLSDVKSRVQRKRVKKKRCRPPPLKFRQILFLYSGTVSYKSYHTKYKLSSYYRLEANAA